MKKFLVPAFLLGASSLALAVSAIPTVNNSAKITTGLTYQQILPSTNAAGAPTSRNALQIENNNTNTDNCWINDDGTVAVGDTTSTSKTVNGTSITAAQASILLAPGQSYTRYYPYTPSAQIVGTCTTTGDSIYAAVQ